MEDISKHWYDVLQLATTSHHTSGSVYRHLESSTDLHRGSEQDDVAEVDKTRNERSGQCSLSVMSQ